MLNFDAARPRPVPYQLVDGRVVPLPEIARRPPPWFSSGTGWSPSAAASLAFEPQDVGLTIKQVKAMCREFLGHSQFHARLNAQRPDDPISLLLAPGASVSPGRYLKSVAEKVRDGLRQQKQPVVDLETEMQRIAAATEATRKANERSFQRR